MLPNAAVTNPRDTSDTTRARALVRFNGLVFHSLAVASFLETAVPTQANRLADTFGAHADIRCWLEQAWWPQRAALGRRLRDYIEAAWPEFDWSAAYQDFLDSYRLLDRRRGSTACEALGLCVAAAQAALFYRALAASADDPALRSLARQAACDHAGHFDRFRALFERCRRADRIGFCAAWRSVTAACRSLRDREVAVAFSALGANWKSAAIVPAFEYPEYRIRMVHLIHRHAALGPVQKLLFRAWSTRAASRPAQSLPVFLGAGRAPSPQAA